MLKTILVVDDMQVNRVILRNILQSEYNVQEAKNGLEAIAYLKKNYRLVSAVLLDIIMPVMDGYGVLEAMQSNASFSQIPVIVTTGDTELSSEKRALSLGANDFVIKPFDSGILKRRLENLIKLRETSAMVNALRRDKLTGLWNRETFFEHAFWEIKRKPAGYYVLSSVDIDNFKFINEQSGMEMGDRVLKSFARMVSDDCDRNGGVCGRIYADHFGVLYPFSDIQESAAAQRAREVSMIDELNLAVTLSVGRFVVTDKSMSVSAMFDRANIARETVKGRYDKHFAFYNESMRKNIVREQEIVAQTRTALAEGQFEVWYQPQYNHSTGALIGAEALARWRHPVWGMVSPGEFIPVFERSGFVYELDKCIWKQVCANLRKWLDEGRNPVPVSVNISRYDLINNDVVGEISGLIERYNLPEELLRLEVTESAFVKSEGPIIAVVKQLVGHGFTVEIDDFGSGYSSLNTLKSVPAQIVKLDMRFLEDEDDGDRGGNILESVVRMAKWLGMSVIAEGVEKVAQADFLKSIGCDYVQGYLYARPMPLQEYELLAKGTVKEEHLIAMETVENLDNNAFWDPESMDSLIFNSYAGAACIFEYQSGKIELVRSTERFAEMIGGGAMTLADTLKTDWGAHLDAENGARAAASIQRSTEIKKEVSCELVFTDLPGCPAKTYIRASFRVIATAGNRCLVYSLAENITAQREAERKERTVAAQLSGIMENIDSGISAVVMEDNGKARLVFANERYYSMLGYTKAQFMAEVREASDVIYSEDRDWVVQRLANAVHKTRRDSYEYRGVKRDGTLIWLHVNAADTFIGGVEEMVQLSVITDITERKQDEERLAEASAHIRSLNNTMQALMDDTPGGFSRMQMMQDGTLRLLYANEGFCRMRGMTLAELMALESYSAMASVQPDDFDMVKNTLQRAAATGSNFPLQFRLRCADGAYDWFSATGRIAKGDMGETFINLYYAEPDEREKRDLSIRETMPFILSTIMEYSNDYAFAKDRELRYICVSPAFLRLAGVKEAADVVGKTDFDLFPDDMAKQFRENDLALFAADAPLVDYEETICGEDGKQHDCRASKHILRDSRGEIIGIYGVSRDITEERAALERLKQLTETEGSEA